MKKFSQKYKIKEGCNSYLNIISKERGIIFYHGFTGSPSEMIPFAKRFEDKGISVYCPRLPGHGTSPEDLADIKMEYWLQAALDHYIEFSYKVKKINIVGLSMGGVIGAWVSTIQKPEKLALLATPYNQNSLILPESKNSLKFLKLIKLFKKKIVFKYKGIACYKKESHKYVKNYKDYIYFSSFYELIRLLKFFPHFIKKVIADTIILQSEKDKVIKFNAPQKIYNKIKSYNKKLEYLKKSNHLLTLDIEDEYVFELIFNFFYKN